MEWYHWKVLQQKPKIFYRASACVEYGGATNIANTLDKVQHKNLAYTA